MLFRMAQIGITTGWCPSDAGEGCSSFENIWEHMNWIKKIAPGAKNTMCE